MPKHFHGMIRGLIKDTFKSASEHNIALHGAAIAFYTIFSTAPLVLIILALITFFLGEEQTVRVFTYQLSQITGKEIAGSLIDISEVSKRNTSGFIASAIATGIVIFGATTVITQLKNSLNEIWGITKPKISSFGQYIFNRILSLIIIFILTALFLTSLLLEGGMTFFAGFFEPYLPNLFSPLIAFATSLLSILVTILFFTIVFRILPDVNARWKDIFIGACVTTILFLIGKYLVGFYLGMTSMQAGYKAAGTFIIFIVWIYYNVQVVLLGAEFTQVYTKRYGKNIRPSWNAEIIASE